MTFDEAVKYCEEHECNECEIFLKNKDIRNDFDKKIGQKSCFENLIDKK